MENRACPCCRGQETKLLASIPISLFCEGNSTYRSDYAELLGMPSAERLPIVECTACEFVFTGVLPPSELLRVVYDEVIDPDIGPFEAASPAWVAHQLRLGSSLLCELGERFADVDTLRVLDFGCGLGSLVSALQGPRVECVGFETSQRRVEALRREGMAVTANPEELSAMQPFHGVVLSDVLEHIPDPRSVLALLRGILTPGGVLSIHVPQFDRKRLRSVLAAARGGVLATRELNPLEHLNYFSPKTLRKLLEWEGFGACWPEPTVDVGLRRNEVGLRRLGNGVTSGLRLVGYLFGQSLTSTHVHASLRRV